MGLGVEWMQREARWLNGWQTGIFGTHSFNPQLPWEPPHVRWEQWVIRSFILLILHILFPFSLNRMDRIYRMPHSG